MGEHDLWKSVGLAKLQLTTLRARLENDGARAGSPEVGKGLGDLQEMLEKLQTRYGLLREIVDRTSDAVFAKDKDGRYLMINRNGAWMFGKAVEEIVGKDDTSLFERQSADRIMSIDRMVMETGRTQTFEETFDIRGVATTLLTTETAWYEPHGKLRGLIGSARDVTERRAAEHGAETRQNRLRALASEIVIAEERLRRGLATKLHEGLGQDLALTRMKLSALRGSSGVELHDGLTRIERLVEQADRSLRSVTLRLSPPVLQDLGLVPALEWLAEDITSQHGLEVQVEDDGSPDADDRMRVLLFRAVRELLVNTATHAGARKVRVRLAAELDQLRITVEDDGAGFDATIVDFDGYGLFGIREQLQHAGGRMDIDSVLGRGTTVTMTVPLTAAAAR